MSDSAEGNQAQRPVLMQRRRYRVFGLLGFIPFFFSWKGKPRPVRRSDVDLSQSGLVRPERSVK